MNIYIMRKNIPEERSTGLMKNMTNDEIYTFDEVLQILKTRINGEFRKKH